MTATSAHIWQSSEKYRWNTGDALGRGATAVVYKARHLVCIYDDANFKIALVLTNNWEINTVL